MRFLILGLAVSCGGNTQEMMPGAGGKLTFDVPANVKDFFVTTGGATPAPTHTFDLDSMVQIPTTATALYLEVGGCLPLNAGVSESLIEFKTPTSQPKRFYIARDCMFSQGGTEIPRGGEVLWFPSVTPRTITETAIPIDFNPSVVLGRVRVLGWYEP